MTIRSRTLIASIENAPLFKPIELVMREDMVAIWRSGKPLMMDRDQAHQLFEWLDEQFSFSGIGGAV